MLIRSNVRNIKIGQECHGEKKPFPLWLCDSGHSSLTVSENTRTGRLCNFQRASTDNASGSLINSKRCGCELKDQFFFEFLPCAGPRPYAGVTEVSQTQFPRSRC